eukprot:scaffold4097_cov166-Amphora_coffeaeformis.AAC.32
MEFLTDDFMRKQYDEGHDLKKIRQRALIYAELAKNTTNVVNKTGWNPWFDLPTHPSPSLTTIYY